MTSGIELKFLGYTVKKEGLENLKLTGHIEANRERGNQQKIHVGNINKWKVEQVLGNNKTTNFIKTYNEQESMDSYSRQIPVGSWQIEKETFLLILLLIPTKIFEDLSQSFS